MTRTRTWAIQSNDKALLWARGCTRWPPGVFSVILISSCSIALSYYHRNMYWEGTFAPWMFIHWQEEWEVTVLAMNMSVHTCWDKMTGKTSTLYLWQQLLVHDKERDKNGFSNQWYFLFLVFNYHDIMIKRNNRNNKWCIALFISRHLILSHFKKKKRSKSISINLSWLYHLH